MYLTVSQICGKYSLSRHGILFQIYDKRIKAKKKDGRWLIKEKDFLDYRDSRYQRIKNGKPLFDKKKGYFSAKETAQIIGCKLQRVYYHLRSGYIKSKRSKCAWVIHLDDIMNYKKGLISKQTHNKHKRKHPYKLVNKQKEEIC